MPNETVTSAIDPDPLTNERIVVAGCGDMGLPMLLRLHQAGFNARGYDVKPASHYGANANRMLADPADIRASSILMVVVRDASQILDLCFTDQAIFRGQQWPGTVIISSTVAPDTLQQLRQQLPAAVRLVDAPMSGAPVAAENATLSYMLGGDERDISRLMPVFRTLGRQIVHVGPLGSGMLAKVMNNYVAACSVVAVRRSLARAAQLGLDSTTLLGIMNTSSGSNWYANNIDAISWSRQGYEPGNTIGIIEKDITCALQACNYTDAFDESLLQALRELPEFP